MPNLIPTTPQWAKRVAPWKIARLYEDDAKGMHDETLLNEVAFALFSRCKSMLMVEEARLGRAYLPLLRKHHPAPRPEDSRPDL